MKERLDSIDVSWKFKAVSNKFQGCFMEANAMGFKEGIKGTSFKIVREVE